jgi:hypothetical protein
MVGLNGFSSFQGVNSMANGSKLSRRKALAVAGAAGLGALVAAPSPALASKFRKLDKAIVDLRDARDYLKEAGDIFGGHKKKAIAAITESIEEIEAAIKFAS